MANKKVEKSTKEVVKNEKSNNNYFKYVVIAAVLIIPFMYSFFYLKAYWDPYGKGNIDNIPVAIVNEDEGDKGEALIDSIKDSKKLKISVVTAKNAEDGLYDKKYYAVIKIPEDFTSSMESASSENKKHATITYSPNQKSNYLASQIINNVVSVVEKNLDNTVNSAIIENLSEQLNSVPGKLQTISDGFLQLQNGTSKLQTGSQTLTDGMTNLKNSYSEINQGVEKIKNGTATLNEAVSGLSSLNDSLTELQTGVSNLSNGGNQITSGLDYYITNVNNVLDFSKVSAQYIVAAYEADAVTHSGIPTELYQLAKALTAQVPSYGNIDSLSYLKVSGNTLNTSMNTLNNGLSTLNNSVSGLSGVEDKITLLQNSVSTLATGASTLYDNSLKIEAGINSLNEGTVTLNNGLSTLNSSVISAKEELDSNITNTSEELKVLNGLAEYSKEPITIETKEVNKVSSYGTAFSPFFISIALWVGCLMMFIVLYYDKEERFSIFGIQNKNRIQRTLCHHALATLSAFILGITLQLFLDFSITNQLLYFGSIILIANAFMAIMEFLIVNFKDVGKFIALILLVLQLAAAGGTFPIETVTKGFRWMHSFLPMTYTVDLLREALVTIENNLLVKNIIVVIAIFLVFFIINIVSDMIRQKKENR